MTRPLSIISLTAVAGVLAAAPAPAAGPASVSLRSVGHLGKVVVNSKHHTLYLFEKDKNGKNSCNGTCAKVWAPVLTVGKPHGTSGIKSSLLGTVKRADGTTQVTYKKHPLYTYDDDHKAGTAEGQGKLEFGAKWYVVNASGNKVDND